MPDGTTRTSALRLLLILIALGFFFVAAVCFLLVGLMIWKGGLWAYIIYAEEPIPHFLGGVVCWFVGYVILRGYRNTRDEWRKLAARCVLFAFSLGLSLVVGEIGLRAILIRKQSMNSMEHLKALRLEGKKLPVKSTHPLAIIIRPSDDEHLVYELQPNLDIDFGHHRVRTNSQGMRDSQEYPLERLAGSVRVVGLGDSGMFGWGLDQDEDYMDVAEDLLKQRGDGVHYEFLNCAVPGYNTQLEVESLRGNRSAFHPDVVVVGWCENDFGLPFFVLQKDNFMRRDVSFLYNLLFNRKKFVDIASGAQIRDQRNFNAENVEAELVGGTDTGGVARALHDLKTMGETQSFKILIFGPLKPDILEICRNEGVDYCNTYEKLPPENYPPEWSVHFMHPRKDGHRVLGELLVKELTERGWLVPSAKADAPPSG